MYNFVIFSLSRWNIEYGCNIKDISIELARTHRVLYVDVPLKRKERWLKRAEKFVKEVTQRVARKENLLKVSDNLWHYIADEVLESVNGISSPFLFDQVNRINGRRFAKVIRKAVNEMGFQEYILINDNDIYNGFYLKQLLAPSMYVYYLRDRLPAMTYWKAQTGRLEPSLIRDVDLVVANSQYLSDYAHQFNKQSYYVGQGCDISLFLASPDETEISNAFATIPKPRIGYIGALNSERLDVGLVFELANRMKDFNFVLVGQEDDGFRQSELHHLKNVFFLGRKEFSDLPKYLYGFDVVINPQLINEITIGNYPRKVDEYLAAGKPVVATKTPAMKPFEEHVYLASDAGEYEKLIRLAMAEDQPVRQEARRIFAGQHTWSNNVDEITKAIEVVRGDRVFTVS